MPLVFLHERSWKHFSLTTVCLISQGSSWLHVGTDQPFKSISIGGANQVWAIAKDGAVFYRGSVSPQNPAGQLKMWNIVITCN